MSWLSQLAAKQQAKKAAREAVTPTLKWDYVDRAPGWADLGQEFTKVFPPGMEPDPAVVAAIRKFCPDYVPLWVRWSFRASWEDSRQEVVVFGRHVLARLVTDPKLAKHEFPGLAPGVANYMERVFMERTEHKPGETDLPGGFQPLNWERVEELRQTYGKYANLSPLDYAMAVVITPWQNKVKNAMKRALARMEREDEIRKRIMFDVDKMSDVEIKNYALHGAQPRARQQYAFADPAKPTTGGI